MKKAELQKITFASVIRPVVSSQRDKYLSVASLEQLRAFLPNIDLKNNDDLLPIAFNACVVNRANRNDDAILTATALQIVDNFVIKPIDIEHDRRKVAGVITTAGFSEFGTDKPLTKDEVKDYKKPFNITLGGVVWRVISPDLADAIEESNDPSSPNYLKICASWELGFYEFNIAQLPPEAKNLEDGELVTDEEAVAKLEPMLRAYGGTGKDSDGKRLCRVPKDEVKALGIGLTNSPAADVQGLAIPEELTKPKVEASEAEAAKPNTENTISQPNEINVKKDSRTMKITNVKDITDESLKTVTASEITDYITEQLKQANDKYEQEKKTVQEALDAAKKEKETLLTENTANKTKLEELEKKIADMETKAKAKEAQEKFDLRMSVLSEKYTLDEDMSKIIAGEIREMNDEVFEKYEKNLAVLLKGKEKKTQQTNASIPNETPPTPTQAVENALQNGQPQTPNVPTTPTTPTPSKEDVYRAAFGEEGWIIEVKR